MTSIIVFVFVGLCTCKSRETEGTKFLCHFKDLAEFPCGDILSSMPLPTKDVKDVYTYIAMTESMVGMRMVIGLFQDVLEGMHQKFLGK